MIKEIKTCPFCGSSASGWKVMNDCWVSCDKCDCQTKNFDSMKEAISLWNRRVTNVYEKAVEEKPITGEDPYAEE